MSDQALTRGWGFVKHGDRFSHPSPLATCDRCRSLQLLCRWTPRVLSNGEIKGSKCLECTTGSHAKVCSVANRESRFWLDEQGQIRKRTIEKQKGSIEADNAAQQQRPAQDHDERRHPPEPSDAAPAATLSEAEHMQGEEEGLCPPSEPNGSEADAERDTDSEDRNLGQPRAWQADNTSGVAGEGAPSTIGRIGSMLIPTVGEAGVSEERRPSTPIQQITSIFDGGATAWRQPNAAYVPSASAVSPTPSSPEPNDARRISNAIAEQAHSFIIKALNGRDARVKYLRSRLQSQSAMTEKLQQAILIKEKRIRELESELEAKTEEEAERSRRHKREKRVLADSYAATIASLQEEVRKKSAQIADLQSDLLGESDDDDGPRDDEH